MEKPKSECCEAEIVATFPILDCPDWEVDKCAKCNEKIHYALLCRKWVRECAPAVFRDFDGNLKFFWQSISDWKTAELLIENGQEYLGQIKEFVYSIGRQYNTQDTDMLSPYKHRDFIKSYTSVVINPEVGELYKGW